MACYHDSTVREQEQEFESGYEPVVEPVEEDAGPEVIPTGITKNHESQPEFQAAGVGGLGLGVLLLGNMLWLLRRRFMTSQD